MTRLPSVARGLWVAARYGWALPTTCVGLCIILVTLPTGISCRCVKGVLEVHGGGLTWALRKLIPIQGGAAALTLGHVVLASSQETQNNCRSHERVHVRQAERWGPLFLPAYGLASLWAWIRGLDPYRDNMFEVEAYEHDRRDR